MGDLGTAEADLGTGVGVEEPETGGVGHQVEVVAAAGRGPQGDGGGGAGDGEGGCTRDGGGRRTVEGEVPAGCGVSGYAEDVFRAVDGVYEEGGNVG